MRIYQLRLETGFRNVYRSFENWSVCVFVVEPLLNFSAISYALTINVVYVPLQLPITSVAAKKTLTVCLTLNGPTRQWTSFESFRRMLFHWNMDLTVNTCQCGPSVSSVHPRLLGTLNRTGSWSRTADSSCSTRSTIVTEHAFNFRVASLSMTADSHVDVIVVNSTKRTR